MEPERTLQPLKTIVPAAKNDVNAKFILLYQGRITLEGQHNMCLALVADETAGVYYAFEPGNIILFANGIFSYSRNNLVLMTGRRGKVEKVGEFTLAFVERPNLSQIKWAPDRLQRICAAGCDLLPFSYLCAATLKLLLVEIR